MEEKYDNDSETILAEGRYGAVNGILARTFTTSIKSRLDFTDKVDKILLNKVFGLPLFLLIMAGVMGFVFNGSAPFIDWVYRKICKSSCRWNTRLAEFTYSRWNNRRSRRSSSIRSCYGISLFLPCNIGRKWIYVKGSFLDG